MLSSKVQELKQDAQEVAEDISNRTQTVAADIGTETKATLENVGERVTREGVEIKSELEGLFGKIYDLLRPEATYEVRQQVRQGLNKVSCKVAAWAEGREEKLASALGNTKVRTRRTVSEHPLASLIVAAGAGAAIAYWLTHRTPQPPTQDL